jgi:predicted O-methyltransferase YrrM
VADEQPPTRPDAIVDELESENARLREQLASVLESSSWRLTRSLRRLRGSSRPEALPPPVSHPAPDPTPAEPAAEVLPIAPIEGATPASSVPIFAPPGHFYSPIVDPAELIAEPRRSRVWPARSRETLGVDWHDADQVALCRDVFAAQHRLSFRVEASDDPTEYFVMNDQYPPLDAWLLEAMIQWLRPRRMIEIGSGFSSLVTARVNRELLGGQLRFTCVEPYPRQFLLDGVPGISDLIVDLIQDVPLEAFDSLGARDILFIDTSHVVKTGGDVTWIFHEIVPRLATGVVVHIHDIFLPSEYPEAWVAEGRSWNESYLVHSFLAFNEAFEVVFGNSFMAERHPDVLAGAFPGWPTSPSRGGASLWLRRGAG